MRNIQPQSKDNGLDGVLIEGKNLINFDFQYPLNLSPKRYVQAIHEEQNRQGTKVPRREPDCLIGIVSADRIIPHVRDEIKRLHDIFTYLLKPFRVILDTPEPNHPNNYQIALFCDILFRITFYYTDLYQGPLIVGSAPLAPIPVICPVDAKHPVKKVDAVFRACHQCRTFSVCSGAVERATIARSCKEYKDLGYKPHFVVYEPIGLKNEDPPLLHLQKFLWKMPSKANEDSNPSRLQALRSLYQLPADRVNAIPVILA